MFMFNGADGANPSGGLLVDSVQIFGSTLSGGLFGDNTDGGTIFTINSAGEESALYNFCSEFNCTDGSGPRGLADDASGNFYGVTGAGGASGNGVVFELTP
jgi:uncharacterized repeat protein (TIGR03803 family)